MTSSIPDAISTDALLRLQVNAEADFVPAEPSVTKPLYDGLTKDEVNIKVENGVMTISGNNTYKSSGSSEVKYIRRELKHSSFKRSFELGDTLDPTKISAEFENGILTITIQKREEAKPHSIDIEIK